MEKKHQQDREHFIRITIQRYTHTLKKMKESEFQRIFKFILGEGIEINRKVDNKGRIMVDIGSNVNPHETMGILVAAMDVLKKPMIPLQKLGPKDPKDTSYMG